MNKAHQIKLNLTKSQVTMVNKSFGVARHSYNWALQKYNELYQEGTKMSAYDMIKLQNSIKKTEFPFYGEVTKCACQYAVHNLYDAWKRYFENLKSRKIEQLKNAYIKSRLSRGLPIDENKLKNIGKPNFKKKSINESYVAVENKEQFKQQDFNIWLPRIGWVKCYENLRFEGKVNNVVIKRIADKYFAVINIEVNKSIPTLKHDVGENQAIVGIDLGIKTLMTLSDGKVFENPRALKSNLKSLKRLQRALSRKEKGSKNRRKQQMKVARKHYRIFNIRKNAIHQATNYIVNNYDKIVIEDLNVTGMIKNRNLAQSISDVSFSEVTRQLAYKAMWHGKEIVKADRFYASSKLCSGCGNRKESLKLSDREYKCDNCGLEIDRDLNAAKNLASLGTTLNYKGSKACGAVTGEIQSGAMKQEVSLLSNNIVHNCMSS